ncbi:MAG: AraC family transcriptional regulator [Leptospirales bacterium]|jgi:AraC-like DNA-binding protein
MRREDPQNSLHIWDGFLLFASHEIVNTFHAHYAASVVVAVNSTEEWKIRGARSSRRPDEADERTGAIRIEDEQSARDTYTAVLIPPNYPHRLSAPGTDVLVLQIDPDLDEFQPLAARVAGSGTPRALQISDVESREVAITGMDADGAGADGETEIAGVHNLAERVARLMRESVGCAEALHLCRDILKAASGTSPPRSARRLDERVDTVLKHLRGLDELPVDINTEEMARLVGLSEERFRVIFKRHMGLRFRRYLLWLRLRRAAVLLGDGANLTEAAHASGFYDSAHFSRTFREMLGHAPSDILGQPRRLRIQSCWPDAAARNSP